MAAKLLQRSPPPPDFDQSYFHQDFPESDRNDSRRIPPSFPRALKPQTDPDPARTEKVVAALKALGQGGKAIADSPLLIPKRISADFGTGGTWRELAEIRSVVFLADPDVSGRKIERHKGDVSRVLHYRLVNDKGDHFVLVHVTADGLITDYDIV